MEDDRISYLPEEIRNHIVSFLPMEDAIRTSVLCKKWRKVCSSLPNLEFQLSYFQQEKGKNLVQFIEIVNQTLAQHDDESNIDKFSVAFNFEYKKGDVSVPYLNEWISFAFNHNVRELYLWGKDWQKFRFSSLTSSYNSLQILTLAVINLEKLPASIKFPNLKSLTLLMLDVTHATVIHQLLLASPLLDHFSMSLRSIHEDDDDEGFTSNKILYVTPANLKSFYLLGWKPFHGIKFVSKNIEQLLYQGEPPNFDSEVLSTVWNAKFNVNTGLLSPSAIAFRHALVAMFGITIPETTHSMTKILMDLRNVIKLELGSYFVEFLNMEPELLARLPTCCSLKHLTLDLYATNNQVQAITFLLKSYPNLQILEMNIKRQCEEECAFNVKELWKTQELDTDGMLEQLNGVQIESFTGSESEFDLLRFLLGNAGTLEVMNIILSNETDAATSSYIKEKIELLTRASPFVDVSVSEVNEGKRFVVEKRC